MTESPPPGYITDDGDGVSSPGSNASSSGEFNVCVRVCVCVCYEGSLQMNNEESRKESLIDIPFL